MSRSPLNFGGLKKLLPAAFRRRQHVVGIDAGKWSVKVASATGAAEAVPLKHLSLHHGDPGAVNVEGVRGALEGAGLLDRPGAFTLPDGSTEIFEFTLPELSGEELETAIAWEVKKSVPSDEFVLHDILSHPGQTGFDVQCVMASRALVQSRFDELRRFGVRPHSLETESSALLACAKMMRAGQPMDGMAIVDLGYSAFRLFFVHKNRVSFTRSLYFGLESLFEQASQQLGLSPEEADAVLRAAGTPAPPDAADQGQRQAFERFLQEALYTLCDEYHRSEYFAKEQKALDPPNEILLCGGGACVPAVIEYVARHLSDKKVEALDPFRGEAPAEGLEPGSGPLWACSVGLAIREAA